MNCKEFEEVINDLACEHLMLANKRVQALAHKEVCARCAARLREERLLTEQLRLVAEAEVVQAPAHVKASLMAAFAQHNGLSAAPGSPAPVRLAPVNLPERTTTIGWSRWAMAAAAAILMVLAIVTMRLLNAQSPVNTQPNAPASIANGTKDSAPQNPTPAKPYAPENQKPSTVADNPEKGKTIKNVEASQGHVQVAQNRKSGQVAATRKASNQVAQNEVVTDYVALTYLNDSTAFESGLVVRVQVPRSTLISMGLPMNVENSSELVKADVVMGDDGVARAIRLVHDLSARADSKQIKL